MVQVHAGPPPEDAHAVAHGREAVLLHPLRQNIRPGGQPQATHQGSHRGAPIQGQPAHICAKITRLFSILCHLVYARNRFLISLKGRFCSSVADPKLFVLDPSCNKFRIRIPPTTPSPPPPKLPNYVVEETFLFLFN